MGRKNMLIVLSQFSR